MQSYRMHYLAMWSLGFRPQLSSRNPFCMSSVEAVVRSSVMNFPSSSGAGGVPSAVETTLAKEGSVVAARSGIFSALSLKPATAVASRQKHARAIG